jgi:hypothetical protein
MKPNEASRTALLIARRRAAHQLLDHGSILNDSFATKILHEDQNDVLQFANAHPLASIGRLFTAARSRIAEAALSNAVEKGIQQIFILGADSTLSLSEVPMAHDRSVSMRWTTLPRRHGNASACLKLNSRFRHGLLLCHSISSETTWRRHLSVQAFTRTTRSRRPAC